jgi:transcriptional regulator with XRE-family HTH domain
VSTDKYTAYIPLIRQFKCGIFAVMKLRKIVGDNVRGFRTKLGLSQESLALDSDVDRAYVGRIERSEFSVSIDILEKLAKTLKISPHLLFIKDAYK